MSDATIGEDALLASLPERATKAAQSWRPGVHLDNLQPLTGGMSSLTYRATVGGGDEIVLKVAPPGLAPVRNRDVLRQAVLLRAIYGQDGVRVPELLFTDAGDPPNVPPLLAMPLVPGECFEPLLEPREAAPAHDIIRRRALEAAEMLAALHAIDPVAAGLGDQPVVTLQDEIDRWVRAFETVPEDLRGDYERCARALAETMPPALPPAIIHGDYRLGNMLCSGGRVEAIIDWEIWAVSDPRVDLTWMTFFTDEGRHPASSSPLPSGMPADAEMIARYQERRGAPVPDLTWFVALTWFKEAAATALLVKRGRKAGELVPSLQVMEHQLPWMVSEALCMIGY